ncbi:MAG TPA: guanitoxin biosynthesis MATE family efflux transporter GntT [Allocoleopsis sp.]
MTHSNLAFLPGFWRLAIVNILSNLMVPLAGLIDIAFLGHLSEIRHLAGVALATILFNYIYWTFGFLRMSTTGMTAQALGREDQDAVLLIGLRHALLALAIGGFILLVQHPLEAIGFAILSATAAVKASGQAYYQALIWGAPANLLGFVLVGWFLGKAQSSKVLILTLVNSLTNIGLDYLFIQQWHWGSAGAGAATAISQYSMTAVGILLVMREVQWQQVRPILPKLYEPQALKAAFALNGEIVIRTFALVTTFSLFTNLSSLLGTAILTTNTVLLQVVSFAAYFIDGLAFATESLAGLFHGKRSTHELIHLLRVSGIASFVLGLLFALLFILLPQPLFRLLTNHPDILDRIPTYVPWLLPILGFGSIAYMLDGYFLGLTQGKILRQASLLSSLLGFLPVAIVAWYFHNNHLLWLALTCFMIARTLTLGSRVAATFKLK